ncbi:MAG: 50S ribosomal protein L11 methyltransferase [Chloroflexota bacterium]
MKWIELSIEVHPEAVDAVAGVFQDNGTGGVAIHQPVDQDREGEEEPRFVGMPVIKAYVPATHDGRESAERIEKALWHLQAFNLSPLGQLQRVEIDEEDWANGWKDHFHPLRIGRFVIKPTWREWQASDDELVIEIDPGMAFGTGLHPTTRLTLQALQERVRPGMAVLDLGAGSGILTLGAAMLGAHVDAVDISEVAVDVARNNVEANGLTRAVTVERGTIEAVADRTYDLVVANIIASVLIDAAPALASVLRPGAALLASGIIEERVREVRSSFEAAGLQIEHQECEGDWWLLVSRRLA